MSKITIGSRVRYSSNWLRSIGCYTGDLPQARGVVVAIQPVGQRLKLAMIKWDTISDDIPNKANVVNLEQCR